ncbi:MAG: TetR/AcrR family transcriptional regulator [Blautia sp.]
MEKTLCEKERLMFQAVIELIEEGMDIYSMKVSDITSRAGVGKGTAYEYFSSKEELIAKALFWTGNHHFQDVLQNIQEKTGLKEQLGTIFDFMENVVCKDRGCQQIFRLSEQSCTIKENLGRELKKCGELSRYVEKTLDMITISGKEEGTIHRDFSDEQVRILLMQSFLGYFIYLTGSGEREAEQKEKMRQFLCINLQEILFRKPSVKF